MVATIIKLIKEQTAIVWALSAYIVLCVYAEHKEDIEQANTAGVKAKKRKKKRQAHPKQSPPTGLDVKINLKVGKR